MVGIYALKNIVTKQYYVGQSKKINKRIEKHFKDLIKNKHVNKHLQNSFNKYGEKSFEVIILEELELKDLKKRESYWVEKYKCLKEGFNVLPVYGGGDSLKQGLTLEEIYGIERAKEIKEKLSLSHKGQVTSELAKKRASEVNKGKATWSKGLTKETDNRLKLRSELVKEKFKAGEIISARKGMKNSEEHKKKISLANKGKERLSSARKIVVDNIVYNSLRQAAKVFGVSSGVIWHRLKSKNFQNYNYV
mgnify:CR=1 FL=1